MIHSSDKDFIIQEEGAFHPSEQSQMEEECISSNRTTAIQHNPNDPNCVCDPCCEQDYYDSIGLDWEYDKPDDEPNSEVTTEISREASEQDFEQFPDYED
jgi:hypothetical protein